MRLLTDLKFTLSSTIDMYHVEIQKILRFWVQEVVFFPSNEGWCSFLHHILNISTHCKNNRISAHKVIRVEHIEKTKAPGQSCLLCSVCSFGKSHVDKLNFHNPSNKNSGWKTVVYFMFTSVYFSLLVCHPKSAPPKSNKKHLPKNKV